MAERARDVLGLVDHAGADRARIDLDQPDDVGVLVADELRDAGEHFAVAAKVARAGQRQMEGRAGAGRVTDVVDEQSQYGRRSPVNGSFCGILAAFHWRAACARLATHVAEQSPSPVRHPHVGRGRRLPAGFRVSRERAQLFLSQLRATATTGRSATRKC